MVINPKKKTKQTIYSAKDESQISINLKNTFRKNYRMPEKKIIELLNFFITVVNTLWILELTRNNKKKNHFGKKSPR